MSRRVPGVLAALLLAAVATPPARAQEIGNGSPSSSSSGTVQDCTEIVSVPVTITVPGHYCLKRDLGTGMSSGQAIRIEANYVTIDLNGFKLGGLAAGPSTQATGIYAYGYGNITIRNGTVRGFRTNIAIVSTGDGSSTTGHIVENIRSENARSVGMDVGGWRVLVRDNFIVNTLNPAENTVIGLRIADSRGSVVSGNVVTGVLAETGAIGIYLSGANGVLVEGNRVFDVTASFARSVYSTHTARVVAKDNVLANRSNGQFGLRLDSADDVS